MLIERQEGEWKLHGLDWTDFRPGITLTKEAHTRLYGALWRLMEYEKTGVNPDEIADKVDTNRVLREDLVKAARRAPEWIRPDKGMPDPFTFVLLCVDGHIGHITFNRAIMTGGYDDEEQEWYLDPEPTTTPYRAGDDELKVLAWMPLPAPYTEGTE